MADNMQYNARPVGLGGQMQAMAQQAQANAQAIMGNGAPNSGNHKDDRKKNNDFVVLFWDKDKKGTDMVGPLLWTLIGLCAVILLIVIGMAIKNGRKSKMSGEGISHSGKLDVMDDFDIE
jgi:hypothetical protein